MVEMYHLLDRREFEQALKLLMDREAWHSAVGEVTESQTQVSD